MQKDSHNWIYSGGSNGLWSVDLIVEAKDCWIFQGKEPFDGFLVRLIKYKDDVEARCGIRYMLIDRKLYPKYVDFGNTYYLPGAFFQQNKEEVTFNAIPKDITRLGAPIDTISSVNALLKEQIQTFFTGSQQSDDASSLSNPNVSPLVKAKKEHVWARIHVHHVGQGDTIILELPKKQLWMIDARFWTNKRRDIFDEWMQGHFKGRHLTRLIISHFHYDHIHSAPHVIEKYKPDQVVITDSLNHGTSSTRRLLHYAKGRLIILKGEEITTLGKLKIHLHRTDQFSNIKKSPDPNDHEISVSFKTDKSFAFLPGDIPGDKCGRILDKRFPKLGTNIKMRFYKVSHHGSKTGYDFGFLNHLGPNKSVISCGQKNRYGHPHRPPLGKLRHPTITWEWNKYCRSYDL